MIVMKKVASLRAARAVKKLGQDISIARRRRGFSQQRLADGAGIGIATVRRLESGDPGISIGNLSMVLLTLGEVDRLGDLIDLARDDVGLALDLERLPKKVRYKARQRGGSPNQENFDGSDL
jgi:transcriptional regulator with XRE-family HTH domain